MAVRVNSCQPTKSGKAWRVNLGGTYYNAFKDSGIENYVGKMIEAEITTSEKFGPAIAAFRAVAEQQVAAPQVPPPQQVVPPTPAPAVAAPIQTGRYETSTQAPYKYAEPNQNVAPYWLPFASNTVNAAIAAGLIKSPNEISMWVRGAQIAAIAAADSDGIPF